MSSIFFQREWFFSCCMRPFSNDFSSFPWHVCEGVYVWVCVRAWVYIFLHTFIHILTIIHTVNAFRFQSRKVVWSWVLHHCDQCVKSFQMMSILLDFVTKIEFVKFDKNPSIIHAFFTILGQKLTYNKIDIIWQLSLHWSQWCKSRPTSYNCSAPATSTMQQLLSFNSWKTLLLRSSPNTTATAHPYFTLQLHTFTSGLHNYITSLSIRVK